MAAFDEADVSRLLADPQIIRNERKIRAVIANAQATIELRADGGLPAVVWDVQPDATPGPTSIEEVPVRSEAGDKLAQTLHSRGFTGIGPTTAHALLGAVGVVDLHLVGSPGRNCNGLWTRTGKRRSRPLLEG